MQVKTIQQSVIKICLFQHLGTVWEEALCNLLLPQKITRFTDFLCIQQRQLPCMISLNIRRKQYILK